MGQIDDTEGFAEAVERAVRTEMNTSFNELVGEVNRLEPLVEFLVRREGGKVHVPISVFLRRWGQYTTEVVDDELVITVPS